MRVAVLELAASWGEPLRALDDVDAALGDGPATDLVLLPEASLTGYVSPDGDFDLTRFAEPLLGPTGRAIAAVAQRRGVVLVAPLVLRDAGACFNAMVAFDRRGEHLFTYRKRHPWFPERWATAGAAPAPRVVIDGVGVTIAVCYDVHFLAEASDALDASDLLLFPSAWVEDEDSRPAMLGALAARHHVAIANANWGAGVVQIAGQGGSSILGADGATLARAAPAPTPSGRRVARADAVVVVAPPLESPPVSQ
jgi:predicted amidohydrolase